jgi:hypothetical protein
MTILRIGSNSKYAAGWDAAFPSKKSTKKKTSTVKVKGGTKKVAKKKTARKKS